MNKIVLGIIPMVIAIVSGLSGQLAQADGGDICPHCFNFGDSHNECSNNSGDACNNAYQEQQPTITPVSLCGWDPQSPQCN